MNEATQETAGDVLMTGASLAADLLLNSVGIFIKVSIVLIVMMIEKKLVTGFIDNLFHNKISAVMQGNDAISVEEKRLKTNN